MPGWNELNLRKACLHGGVFEVSFIGLTWMDDPVELDPEILNNEVLTMLEVVCKLPPTPTQKEIQGET